MGQVTEISWTDHTFNLWWGCTKVSEGCEGCYAEAWAKRWGFGWGPFAERRFFGPKHWAEPLKWNSRAARDGVRRRVFCASMADVFEDRPEYLEERQRLWDVICMTRNLDWLLLTKRPENIARLLDLVRGPLGLTGLEQMERGPLPNGWLGTTVESQRWADNRIPHLLKIPAVVRFLSCEPLLGPVDLGPYLDPTGACCGGEPEYQCKDCPATRFRVFGPDGYPEPGIHWVIVGGESGDGARPMHPDWAHALRDQCQEHGVAFHFKQWGEWRCDGKPSDADEVVRLCLENPNGRWVGPNGEYTHDDWDTVHMTRVGKKSAGRLLDGRTWDEFPNVATEALAQ